VDGKLKEDGEGVSGLEGEKLNDVVGDIVGVEDVVAGDVNVVAGGVNVVAGGVNVVAGGVNVVAGGEAAGVWTLKEDEVFVKILGGDGIIGDVDLTGTSGGVGNSSICTGESWIAFRKRLILYESYATTSSTTINASIWSRIGIVQPGTAKVIVLSVAMITLTPSVSAYNKFAFKVKLMSVWSR